MDSVIPFVTVLFLLSMVCERVAEFLKHYLSCRKFLGAHIVGDTATKYPENSPEELRRHYRILKLNLVCGFITAFLCHASLFDILKNMDKPGTTLGWPDKISITSITFCLDCIPANIAFLVGCLLTGAFISLGSKFWHDLLDILLAVKNAKKTISELSATTDYTSLPNVEKYELIAAAIRENKESWKNNIANYRGVSIGEKLVGEDLDSTKTLSIRFNVSEKVELPLGAKSRVPSFIYYKGYRIPTDVLSTGDTVALGSPVSPTEMPRPLGSSIGRAQTSYSGTLGISVKLTIEGKTFLCGLSCYHVLFPEELKKRVFQINSTDDKKLVGNPIVHAPSRFDYQSQNNIGSVLKGKFTHFIDIGFFQTTTDLVSCSIHEFGKPGKLYSISQTDENRLKVKICGRTSGIVRGTVLSIKTDQMVTYFKGTTSAFEHELEDLIQVSMKTLPGDSGAALLTESNELVGIIVASDEKITYAIPIQFLKSNFNIDFDLQNN